MPTITLQVGQCGNQVGQQLWAEFDAQCRQPPSNQQAATGVEWEFFRESATHPRQRRARCLLVDTEPKVVRAVLQSDPGRHLFCDTSPYLGESGRGNNWAYGYSQLHAAMRGPSSGRPRDAQAAGQRVWDDDTLLGTDRQTQETCTHARIMEGVRREAEACDGAPNFLLLHSLGGGSGAGLGSRVLEAVREEYPLNYMAALSVAPSTGGDAPLQALNAVMSLSFLQAYADAVMLFNNADILAGHSKAARPMSVWDVNRQIAGAALGVLWPLSAAEVRGGASRIRDMVCTVAADPCMKLVEAAAVPLSTALGSRGLWQEGCKALAHALHKHNARSLGAPVTVSSCLLLGRAMRSTTGAGTGSPRRFSHGVLTPGTPHSSAPQELGQAEVVGQYVQAIGGAARFTCPSDAHASVHVRESAHKLVCATESRNGGSDAGSRLQAARQGPCPAAAAVINSSRVVRLLSRLTASATALCQAGAYLHWFERHGCSRPAVREALEVVLDVQGVYADCYGLSTP